MPPHVYLTEQSRTLRGPAERIHKTDYTTLTLSSGRAKTTYSLYYGASMDDIRDAIVSLYSWMKVNDIPNWCVIIFTVLVWPLVLLLVVYWLNTHKVNNIHNLRVSLAKARIRIGDNVHEAFDIVFTNNTEAVVYLRNAKLRQCAFVHIDTSGSRDIASNAIDLTFLTPGTSVYQARQITLDTGSDAKVSIAVNKPMPDEFYSYGVPRLYRILGRRKYFVLEYTAMVGEKKYSVATAY